MGPDQMGERAATDDLRRGHLTQEWLATSDEPETLVSGGLLASPRAQEGAPGLHPVRFQDALLEALARHTAVQRPCGARLNESAQ